MRAYLPGSITMEMIWLLGSEKQQSPKQWYCVVLVLPLKVSALSDVLAKCTTPDPSFASIHSGLLSNFAVSA